MTAACPASQTPPRELDDELRTRVYFVVEDDTDAERIEIVLEALGYDPIRARSDEQLEPDAELRRIVTRFARWYRLRSTERATLELILRGLDADAMARALGVSEKTVKWYQLSLLGKAGVPDREGLLRLALLGRAAEPLVSLAPEEPS